MFSNWFKQNPDGKNPLKTLILGYVFSLVILLPSYMIYKDKMEGMGGETVTKILLALMIFAPPFNALMEWLPREARIIGFGAATIFSFTGCYLFIFSDLAPHFGKDGICASVICVIVGALCLRKIFANIFNKVHDIINPEDDFEDERIIIESDDDKDDDDEEEDDYN